MGDILLENAITIGKNGAISRIDATRLMNKYFVTNNLRDPENSGIIIPNDTLRKLFNLKENETITYYNLQHLLSKHFIKEKKEPCVDSNILKTKSFKEELKHKANKINPGDIKNTENDSQKLITGFAVPAFASDKLVDFLNNEMTDILKKHDITINYGGLIEKTTTVRLFNDYFIANNLNDPYNRRIIISNEPLQKLFDLKENDMFDYFSLNKLLKPHFDTTVTKSDLDFHGFEIIE